MNMKTEKAPVVVVTGASRGVGRGIAIGLGAHGCTVYVTGRSETQGSVAGTIHDTAAAVTAAGGRGIAVRVDHGDDAQVKALFERIGDEQGGLDILVNNAFATHKALIEPGPFWEKPLELVRQIDIGLRGAYVASYYAAPLMLGRSGLVVFTSGPGAVAYAYNPAYGAHKAGVDKMAADMAVEFGGHGVSVVSLWPGIVLTELVQDLIAAGSPTFVKLADTIETPEFSGHVLWALYNDPRLPELSGDTLIGAELAQIYGILDAGGRSPPSRRNPARGVEPPVRIKRKLDTGTPGPV